MTTRLQTIAAFICAAFFLISAAWGQQQCGPTAAVFQMLAARFSEVLAGQGTIPPNRVAHLFISRKNTWTVLVTTPTGLSCIVAAGEDWETITPDFLKTDPEL